MFQLECLDDYTKDASLLLLQVMLFAFPLCFFAGIFHLISGRFGLGAVITAEGMGFVSALLIWRAGHGLIARCLTYFGIGLGASIQNAIIPIASGYLMIFPLLIAVSYMMFFKEEKKLRIFGALYMITVAIVSFFANGRVAPSTAISFGEMLFTQVSTLLGIALATLFIFRFHVLNSEKREREIVLAHQLVEEAHVKNLSAVRATMLCDMAGGIAHEILNPLTVINGSAFVMGRDPHDSEKIAAQAVKIKRMVQRITRIVDGLFAFTGEMRDSTPPQNFPLADAIDQAVQFFMVKMKELGIRVTIDLSPQSIDVVGKKAEITEVMISLISNAIDAVGILRERWITISAAIDQREVCLRFVDAGRGIPEEIAAQIMLPFFTTKEVGKGSGLGLSMARGICVAHGGRLELDNTAKNTTFMMFLPLAGPNDEKGLKAG